MKSDASLLQAALVGYQTKLVEIQQAMAEIRRQLGQKSAPAAAVAAAPSSAKPPRRKMSAAGRKRIAAAQRKRWAEYNKLKAGDK